MTTILDDELQENNLTKLRLEYAKAKELDQYSTVTSRKFAKYLKAIVKAKLEDCDD